jgi:hypothetical protein
MAPHNPTATMAATWSGPDRGWANPPRNPEATSPPPWANAGAMPAVSASTIRIIGMIRPPGPVAGGSLAGMKRPQNRADRRVQNRPSTRICRVLGPDRPRYQWDESAIRINLAASRRVRIKQDRSTTAADAQLVINVVAGPVRRTDVVAGRRLRYIGGPRLAMPNRGRQRRRADRIRLRRGGCRVTLGSILRGRHECEQHNGHACGRRHNSSRFRHDQLRSFGNCASQMSQRRKRFGFAGK